MNKKSPKILLVSASLIISSLICCTTTDDGKVDGVKVVTAPPKSLELKDIDDKDEITPSYLISYGNTLYYAPDDSVEAMSPEGLEVIKNQLKSRIAWLKELVAALQQKNVAKSFELLQTEAELYTDLGAAIDGDNQHIDNSKSYGQAFFNDIIDNEELSAYFFDDFREITNTWGKSYQPVRNEMIRYLSSPLADPNSLDEYADDFATELESLNDIVAYMDAKGWENIFDAHFSGYMATVVTWYTQDFEGGLKETPDESEEGSEEAEDGLALLSFSPLVASVDDSQLYELAARKKNVKRKVNAQKRAAKRHKVAAASKKRSVAAKRRPPVKKKPSIAKKRPSRSSSTTSLASAPGVSKKKSFEASPNSDAVAAKHLKNKSSLLRPSSKVKVASTEEIQKPENLLGKGSAGDVYRTKAKIGKDDVDVAAKVVKGSQFSPQQEKDLKHLQKKVGPHPNVIGTLDVKRDKKANKVVIVSELGGQNLSKVKRPADKKLASRQVSKNMADAADGLSHMHKKGVFHGDVKPENVVVRPNGKAALIDWDGAKNTKKGFISPKAKDMNTSGGSALSGQSEHYTAPEIRRATADINKNVKIDPKSMDRTKKNMADAMAKKKIDGGKADVYALGVTSSNQMIGHDKTVEFTKLSNKDRRSSFLNKEGVPPKMKKNIMDMTNDDPGARPSMDEVSKRFREIERDGE